MADERNVDQLTSEELFQQAMEQTPAEPTPPEPAEPTPAPAPVAEPPAPSPTAEESIPSWRLREEAEARRVAEDRARALEARLTEIATHIKQQQHPPDFFESPGEATRAIVAQFVQPLIERQEKQAMYQSRMIADVVHGADVVSAAEQAFLKARDNMTLDPADYEKVVQSPNRYDAAVQWHRRQNVLSSVGDDPGAWFKSELQKQLKDPKFQAEVLESIRGSAAQKPSAVKLPPSLSKATAAAANNSGERGGDMSDQSLFEYAMRR